jgi:hypothetical protein
VITYDVISQLLELLAVIAIVALTLVDTLENGSQESVLQPIDQCM